jgi:hypothetical protein
MQWTKCVIAESRRLRMFNGGLVYRSICLGIPFIAPRELGAVGAPFGRPLLPSVRWRTGLSGAHRTVNSAHTRRGRESPDWLVSSFVGHQTVWCATWPLPEANVAGSCCTTGTPDCSAPRADCPMNFSRHRPKTLRAESWAGPCIGRPVLRSLAPFPYSFLCFLLLLLDLTLLSPWHLDKHY